VPGDDQESVFDAVRFIAHLRQAADLTQLPVGRNVVVIGGGMTAIDAAVQSKLLGAMNVTLAYRRGRDAMGASQYEQDLAASKGVKLMFNVQPKALIGDEENFVEFIELEYTEDDGSGLKGTGETVRLETDQVFRAIGQTLTTDGGLALDGRKIAVSETGKTSNDKVWAGGDCAAGGDDLTVTAVAEGRDAAMDIHATLMGGAA
jgi:glutamate synthase (NADPH/NADH) small chain